MQASCSAQSTLSRQTHLLWTRQISRPGSLPACPFAAAGVQSAAPPRYRESRAHPAADRATCMRQRGKASALLPHLGRVLVPGAYPQKATEDRERKQSESHTPVQHSSVMAADTRAALSMIEPIFSTFESSAHATSLGLLAQQNALPRATECAALHTRRASRPPGDYRACTRWASASRRCHGSR